MKKALFIVNPVSGKIRIKQNLMSILDQFEKAGYRTEVAVTQRKGHASEIVRERSENADVVICCGGDGTLNEVIHGLMSVPEPILCGYIPCGSTNDFAGCIGLPDKPLESVRMILDGAEHTLDIGSFNSDSYFSYIASFGAFTSASYSTPQSTKNTLGHFAYVLEGIKDLKNISPIHGKCVSGDKCFTDDFVFGAVMNSTSIGGIVKLNDGLVDMSDGEFEVILVRMPKTLFELNRIVHSITTSDFDNESFEFFKASEISFNFEDSIAWSLDGEYRNGGTNVKIINIHEGLHIVK